MTVLYGLQYGLGDRTERDSLHISSGQIWKGELRLDPHLHPQNLGWKAVEGKLVHMQCNMDVAPKALLKVVRCNCKMGCDTLRYSCRKAGLECSTGCGECRGICANMYENTTEVKKVVFI